MNKSDRKRLSTTGPGVQTEHSSERIIRTNGVDLCVQTFGDRADTPILLIHGAATSMLGWEDEFCERLAAGSRFVIRYDHRDTGRSVSYEPGAPPYTLRDLVADAVGLLDALGLGGAHLVGRSMGGGIAMLAALDYPDRVASLTLVGTSPGGSGLPPMSEEFLAYISGAGNPDWSDREAVIDHVIGLLRVYSGGSGHFDEATMRDLVGRDVDRTVNIASSKLRGRANRRVANVSTANETAARSLGELPNIKSCQPIGASSKSLCRGRRRSFQGSARRDRRPDARGSWR